VLSYSTIDSGVAGFIISNYTGNNSVPGFFPVTTDLIFTHLELSYVVGGVAAVVDVSDLGPGDTIATTLADTTLVDSASLTGTLEPVVFIADGVEYTAASSTLSVQLLPLFGETLVPDVDFVLITTEPTPEPAAFFLVLAGIGLLALRRR
jgi:hypothetical protein